MEQRSRSENHQRRKSKRRSRSIAFAAAAALIIGAGGLLLAQRDGTDQSAGSAAATVAASGSPAGSAGPKASLPPAAAAAATPAATASAAAKPTAAPTASSPSAAAANGQAGAGQRVKLAFVGDVIFASTVEAVLKQNGADSPYRDLADVLKQPDLTLANLESPITTRGEEQKKEYTYRSKPEFLEAFQDAGFDAVNLANNHIMDYGADGLLDTLSYLDKAGIGRTGAGKDVEDAYRPVVLERNGVKVAVLGLSHKVPENSWKAGPGKPGTTQLYDPKAALEAIGKAKQQADVVIVIAHWGEERKDLPLEGDRTLARKMIDAGADLIVGGHPHVLQGFETYKGKWIAYSLGNFLFTTNTVPATWETVVLNAECTKGGDCSLSMVPVWNKFARPVRMSAADGAALFERLSKVSFGAAVDGQGRVGALAGQR